MYQEDILPMIPCAQVLLSVTGLGLPVPSSLGLRLGQSNRDSRARFSALGVGYMYLDSSFDSLGYPFVVGESDFLSSGFMTPNKRVVDNWTS